MPVQEPLPHNDAPRVTVKFKWPNIIGILPFARLKFLLTVQRHGLATGRCRAGARVRCLMAPAHDEIAPARGRRYRRRPAPAYGNECSGSSRADGHYLIRGRNFRPGRHDESPAALLTLTGSGG